jgi:hypothetical protein
LDKNTKSRTRKEKKEKEKAKRRKRMQGGDSGFGILGFEIQKSKS